MPRASASREARSTISVGISSCIITASTGSRNMAGTSSGRMLRFAPGKTMMPVLPARLHEDGRISRGRVLRGAQQAVVHALVGEGFAQGLAVAVVPHAAGKGHAAAQARRGDGGVCALAAGGKGIALAEHRLARQGDVVNARHHVHVDGPDDEDFRSFFLAYRHESHLVSPRL